MRKMTNMEPHGRKRERTEVDKKEERKIKINRTERREMKRKAEKKKRDF